MKPSSGDLPIITKTRIVADLKRLGVASGQTIMLHASVKAIGWIAGGPDTVLQALLDTLTSKGTIMMLAGWDKYPGNVAKWSHEKQQAYFEEGTMFDPATSQANTEWSVLNEYLRNHAGACRSSHPEESFVALGYNARWITQNHPLQYGYGPGSPLEKLYDAEGKVLLLGAPLSSITALHYAENLANIPNKKIVNSKLPMPYEGTQVWVDIEEFDTDGRIFDWQGEDYFAIIGREYLKSGKGGSGKVGEAQSYLLDVKELIEFGIKWMERTFNR